VAAHTGGDSYWGMHDLLFEHQQDSEWALDDEHLVEYAAAAGADPALVKADLEANTFEAPVRTDFLSGVRSGVNGTPTFFINGERFEGDWSSVSSFAATLEAIAAGSHPLTQESRA
jgi:protein-disulfide isomerase